VLASRRVPLAEVPVGLHELVVRLLEARLAEQPERVLDNLSVHVLVVYTDDLPVLELVPDPRAKKALVQFGYCRNSCLATLCYYQRTHFDEAQDAFQVWRAKQIVPTTYIGGGISNDVREGFDFSMHDLRNVTPRPVCRGNGFRQDLRDLLS
jgi:hypothetical protein